MSDAAQPTAAEVRAAAEAVKAAIDRHLAAVENRTGGDDPQVLEAFDALAAAAEFYDELLYDVHDEVTPFEVPTGELPAYTGPQEPAAISVLIRRDYTVADPQRLLAQAERICDPAAVVGSALTAGICAVFGEYEPDEIAARHQEFGLEEGDSTLWVVAADRPAEAGEWLAEPFDQADPEVLICRFDVSAVFDDEADGMDEADEAHGMDEPASAHMAAEPGYAVDGLGGHCRPVGG